MADVLFGFPPEEPSGVIRPNAIASRIGPCVGLSFIRPVLCPVAASWRVSLLLCGVTFFWRQGGVV